MASVHPTDRESNENVSTWKAVTEWLPFPFGDHPWWMDGTTRVPDEKEDNPRLWRAGVINIFDHNGFDFQVFIVAASGFLTDSYALFATNVILPILAFLYWPNQTNRQPELYINVATLAGSAFGQLLFGWLTDRLGRRKLYGLELVLVIFATLGMSQASTGMHKNMDILSWIAFYRFFLGMGIGAEYPLSAVITAEFASTKYRARMMAAVFLMQPLGQLLAVAVGWGVMAGLMRSRDLQGYADHGPAFEKLSVEKQQQILSTLDSVWRWVVGVGCIPALLAIVWRFSIPESPRYTMDVAHDPLQALSATKRQFRRTARLIESESTPLEDRYELRQLNPRAITDHPSPARSPQLDREDTPGFWDFFFEQGNIRYLAATSVCWFLLDFCFYALGINSSRPLAALWASGVANVTTVTTLPASVTSITIPVTHAVTAHGSIYNLTTSIVAALPPVTATLTTAAPATYSGLNVPDYVNIWDPTYNMFEEISNNARSYIYTISISSLVGSGLLILLIDYIPRKMWLVWSFLVLSVLFAVLGGVLVAAEFTPGHWATVVLYALCQLFFNLGPNTLTYIIPTEIFPTRFRATCHGISAACGKIGAIIVLIVTEKTMINTNPKALDKLLGVFSVPLAIGALFAWAWIPELQTAPVDPPRALRWPRLPNKSLEQLAKGWTYATGTDLTQDPWTQMPRGENQRLGFSKKLSDLWGSFRYGGRRRVLTAEVLSESLTTADDHVLPQNDLSD
ncbi:major facilitator superfamily domain-containing protein [Penicillium riverlandense]|uniref:major facilitator superfamily domain-containing protein n=1 Tax=Penicillium riverlandense TaxID=1903569 RepID=UPI00254678A3|nr:major facilitator superfamily domain-containing protein [Penicillium riverlandense]KAJ5820319.1 major facilitator superfamily domain-containing protein [Penicillium riverlandense]